MPHLRWPENSDNAPEKARVAAVPRTANYEHPYTQRVPKPPPIESDALRNRKKQKPLRVAVQQPDALPRRNPAKLGLYLSLASALTLCTVGYVVMSANYEASREEVESIRENLRRDNVPLAYEEETPADFVKSLDVTGVRISGKETRASINGQIVEIGDLISENHGLVFLGPDAKSEHLIFRDSADQLHQFNLNQN